MCRTPIFNTNGKNPGAGMIYVGTLTAQNDVTPGINVWCESQLSWVSNVFDITSLPQGVPGKNA